MHSCTIFEGARGGGGGRHVTHSSHNSPYVFYVILFIRNISKHINYIMKYVDSHPVSWSIVGDGILLTMHKNLSAYLSNRYGCLEYRVQALSKTPIKISEAVYTVKLISYLQIHTHISTLLFLTREFARKRYSVSEQVKKTF